jgi:hypothetical protein
MPLALPAVRYHAAQTGKRHLEIGSGEIQKGILAKPIGVALAHLRDLDDAQCDWRHGREVARPRINLTRAGSQAARNPGALGGRF